MKDSELFDFKEQKEVAYTVEDLISFENEVVDLFEQGKIRAPVHLSKGNELPLLKIFPYVHPDDWVFSTWRSHYHALLHGVSKERVMSEIIEGNSITLNFADHHFYTSAIVGGIAPIATGTALALKRNESKRRVWCFVGDMAAQTGIFHESYKYAILNGLPIIFVIEANNFSTNTPTSFAWWRNEDVKSIGSFKNMFATGFASCIGNLQDEDLFLGEKVIGYSYTRGFPHQGIGKFVIF